MDSGKSPASPAAAAAIGELQESTVFHRENSLEIDSDYFRGFCHLLVADLQTALVTTSKPEEALLECVQESSHAACPSSVYTGQALSTSIEALPSPPLVSGSLKMLGSVSQLCP